MTFVVILLIIVAVGFVVVYPLGKAKSPAREARRNPKEDLLAQKEAALATLKELKFDYALGNLSPKDHQELERRYKDKAVAILKELDAPGQKTAKERPPEAEIEAEILRLRRSAREASRKKGAAPAESTRPRPTPDAAASEKVACPHCHSAIVPGAEYCPYCGSSLAPLVCPQCAAPYRSQDRFCAQCGAALTEGKKP